jgi:hypothetical protein
MSNESDTNDDDHKNEVNYGSLLGSAILQADPAGTHFFSIHEKNDCQSRWGWYTGVTYTILLLGEIVMILGLHESFMNWYDPQATASAIIAHPLSFKTGILLEWIMCSIAIVVSILLGHMLLQSGANNMLTILSLAFRLMQQVVLVSNLLNLCTVSLLMDSSIYPSMKVRSVINSWGTNNDGGIDMAQSMALLFWMLHKLGEQLVLLFLGVILLLLGLVVGLHTIFPRFLGGTLTLAGLVYLSHTLLYMFKSGYCDEYSRSLVLSSIVCELVFPGWLMLKSKELIATNEE